MLRSAAVACLTVAGLVPALAGDANIAYAARLRAEPAASERALRRWVDGDPATAGSFEVGTSGHGVLTFEFERPRRVSGVRSFQPSDVYYTTAYRVEVDTDGDGSFDATLAESTDAPLKSWAEHRWAPVAVRALRFTTVDGVSKGRRAHPTLSEIEVVGEVMPGDIERAGEAGVVLPRLPYARPVKRNTPLVVAGRPLAVLVPRDAAYGPAVAALVAGLRSAGVEAEGVADIVAAAPTERTVVCLGTMLTNPLLERLYWNRYTFADALTPGPGRYLVHTVFDPHPLNAGRNIVVVACSDPAGATLGVKALLGAVKGRFLPWAVLTGPEPAVPPADASKIAAGRPDPTFCEFTRHANSYLKTGCAAHAQQAFAVMRTMAAMYAPGGERHSPVGSSSHRKMPWPEETTSWEILCAWDAFEEHPGIDAELRLAFSNSLLQFTRDLVAHTSGYGGIGKSDLVSWNHTTFPLLGIHFGARYFHRIYRLADMPEKLAKARACFLAQARSWKPQEDADSYLTLTTAHSQVYCLAENEMGYFTSGNMKAYADYMVGICDSRGLGSGFGDSNVSSNPNLPGKVLPLALWWTSDGGYKWLMHHYTGGTWRNPYERGVAAAPPDRFLGVNVFRTDAQVYQWMQSRPTYNERFVKSDVPTADSFDKISFRESWEPDAQYLLLDGLSRGKHLHYDGNSIIEFVEAGERWLLDSDYLTRNTTEHSMLSVLRDGRADALVPSLSGLTAYASLPRFGYTDTYTRDYNHCDWRRQIVWRRGEWFVVADTVTAREAGSYDFDLTWKTIDEAGQQRVVSGRHFVAERGGAAGGTMDCTAVDDPHASGGKAMLMDRATSRLAFGVGLPEGEYSLTVIAHGVDGSSDSLWVTVDGADKTAFHTPQLKYGRTGGDHTRTRPTPTATLAGTGPHLITVTLRELPPVRVDRFVFQPADGTPAVYEAEDLPPPPAPEARPDTARRFHIRSAHPVTAWVTNHERAGITVPVSILHQRQSGTLQAGRQTRFASLLAVSRPGKRRDVRLREAGPGLLAVTGPEPALVCLGDTDVPGLRAEANAALLTPRGVAACGLGRLSLGGITVECRPPANVQLDLDTGRATLEQVTGAVDVTVTREGDSHGAAISPGQGVGRLQLPDEVAGAWARTVAGLAGGRAEEAEEAEAAGPATEAPVWTAFEHGGRINAVKVADLGDGRGQRVFVCRGPSLHCLDASGALQWSFAANSLARDVAFGDLRAQPGSELVLGSADTHVYILGADGVELGKHQMRGIPWSRSFGERAFAVFNVAVGDLTGDGEPEILATMQNYDVQAMGADWKLLWKHDYALHGSMQMSLEDTDGDDTTDAIFIGDKYGYSTGIRPDGSLMFRRYTSIGDVCYAVGDLDGDSSAEVATGSSTGDVVATPAASAREVRWRFDNFGYAANRLRAADVDGDGRDEVLLASGTGYVYCLDGDGTLLWQDRAGVCVNDVLPAPGPDGLRIAYCDEAGVLRLVRGNGDVVRSIRTPAPPRQLALLRGTVLVALADGRLVAYPIPR